MDSGCCLILHLLLRVQRLEKAKATGPTKAIGSSTAQMAVPSSSQSATLGSANGLAVVDPTHKNTCVRTTITGATIIPSMGTITTTTIIISNSCSRPVVTLASASGVLAAHLSLIL